MKTFSGLVEALLVRLKRRMRPFGIKATKNPIELLLSDGFYAVFHKRWQEYFPDEQLKVIDGSKYCKLTHQTRRNWKVHKFSRDTFQT